MIPLVLYYGITIIFGDIAAFTFFGSAGVMAWTAIVLLVVLHAQLIVRRSVL